MSKTEKKYKYTRQLLKIAKQEGGYTNKNIEKKAGLKGSSSSLASRWLNGHALATERQMQYFINNYGHLLKRQMEHLFYCEEVDDGVSVTKYKKLSGEVIFKHQIKVLSKKGNSIGITALIRLVILRNENKYHVVSQVRGGLTQKQLCDRVFLKAFHSDSEDANWYAYDIKPELDIDDVLRVFNSFKVSLLKGTNPVDQIYSGSDSEPIDSDFFNNMQIQPLEYALFQKLMKLGLQSELLPF